MFCRTNSAQLKYSTILKECRERLKKSTNLQELVRLLDKFTKSFQLNPEITCNLLLSSQKDAVENYCRDKVTSSIKTYLGLEDENFYQQVQNVMKNQYISFLRTLTQKHLFHISLQLVAEEAITELVAVHYEAFSSRILALLVYNNLAGTVQDGEINSIVSRLETLGKFKLKVLFFKAYVPNSNTKDLLVALASLSGAFPNLDELFNEDGGLIIDSLKHGFKSFINSALNKEGTLRLWLELIFSKDHVDAICILSEASRNASQFNDTLSISLERILFERKIYNILLPEAMKLEKLVSAILQLSQELKLDPAKIYQVFIKGGKEAINLYIRNVLIKHLQNRIAHLSKMNRSEFPILIGKLNSDQISEHFNDKIMKEHLIQRLATLSTTKLLSMSLKLKEKKLPWSQIYAILCLDFIFPDVTLVIGENGMPNVGKVVEYNEKFWESMAIKPKELLQNLLKALKNCYKEIEAYAAVYESFSWKDPELFYKELENTLLNNVILGEP